MVYYLKTKEKEQLFMPYTNLNEALARLDEIEATVSAYSHAMGMLSLDAATAAPLGAAEGRGKTMAVLSKVVYFFM